MSAILILTGLQPGDPPASPGTFWKPFKRFQFLDSNVITALKRGVNEK